MTGDRVAEIRERVEALASSEGYGYLNADKTVKANAPADLAYLLAELESANRRLAEAWGVGYWQGVDDERQSQDYDGGFTGPNRANPYRAALNQGGETNAE